MRSARCRKEHIGSFFQLESIWEKVLTSPFWICFFLYFRFRRKVLLHNMGAAKSRIVWQNGGSKYSTMLIKRFQLFQGCTLKVNELILERTVKRFSKRCYLFVCKKIQEIADFFLVLGVRVLGGGHFDPEKEPIRVFEHI